MVWSRTNQLIAAAAAELGARAEPLGREHTDYFMRLSHGDRSAIVSKTRSPFLTQVAQGLANNKHLSRELLRARGLPCAEGVLVDEAGDIAGPAVRALLARHGRLVVKPNWGNRGIGVATDVRDLATLGRARERARAIDLDEEVLVEPFIAGTNVRVAVIAGQALAAVEVVRPKLQAGRSAAAQVAALNRDPQRGTWSAPSLCPIDQIEADEDLAGHLEVYELDLEAAIPDGREVEITGDELAVIDRTDEVHPEWLAVAASACDLLGVDVGGVDLRGPLAAFAGPPAAAQGSALLLEVNVVPALHLHALPTEGRARPVFAAFVAYCLQLPGAPPPRARVRV
jgi:cyanophycin synthetase